MHSPQNVDADTDKNYEDAGDGDHGKHPVVENSDLCNVNSFVSGRYGTAQWQNNNVDVLKCTIFRVNIVLSQLTLDGHHCTWIVVDVDVSLRPGLAGHQAGVGDI